MPAERTSFGALADITVTTSYRGPSLSDKLECASVRPRFAPWDSRRGRALDCAQGTTSAEHLARRDAGGGRDASWRMRVAAVTCCEADDCVVHSAALRVATPRPLDATLACHRRPTSTRRRPPAVSTGARRRHNGASVSRKLTEYSRATPHALGVHHARLRGRSQRMLRVHVELDRSAAWTRLGVRLAQDRQTRGRLSLARSLARSLSLSLPGLSGMVRVSDVPYWTKSAGTTPPSNALSP